MKNNYIVLLIIPALVGSYQQILTLHDSVAKPAPTNSQPGIFHDTSASEINAALKAEITSTLPVASTRIKPNLIVDTSNKSNAMNFQIKPRPADLEMPTIKDGRFNFEYISDYKPGIFHDKSAKEIDDALKTAITNIYQPDAYAAPSDILASTQRIAQKYSLNLSDTAHLENLLTIYQNARFYDGNPKNYYDAEQEIVNFLNSRLPKGKAITLNNFRVMAAEGERDQQDVHYDSAWTLFTTNLGHAYNAIMPGKSLGSTLKQIHTTANSEAEAQANTRAQQDSGFSPSN